jgi:hypothetical protein
MPYVNAKFIFPLLVAAAIGLLLYNNSHYYSDLFIINADNASLNISTIILWAALIILSIMAFIKSWSLVPLMGLSTCLYLLTGMTGRNWLWFSSWLVLGVIIYFLYGYKKSRLAAELGVIVEAVGQHVG